MRSTARGLSACAWLLTFAGLFVPRADAAADRLSLIVEGHELALWTAAPKASKATLLLVHGRTWSSLPNFDLATSGKNRSVFDALVRKGYAVYALDLRGYGASARDSTGWLTPARAVADVRAALDHIAARHPRIAQRPALLGYSRGAQVAVMLAQSDPGAASAIVLFGFPPGVRNTTSPAVETPPRAPTTAAAAAEDFITPGAASRMVIEAYVSAALAADPIRVDWRDENQFLFEPAKITTPTLLIYGVNDPFRNAASATFFEALAARDRAYVVLPDSDHAAHVENSARAWVHAIDGFLQSPRAKE